MKKRVIPYIISALAVTVGAVMIIISVMFEFIVPNKNTDSDVKNGEIVEIKETEELEGNSDTVKKVDDMVNDDTNNDPAGKVYYVDAVNGNDKNDGLSKQRPLLSLYRVSSLKLKPGDHVLFKRNCVWNGQLIIESSGTKEHPIVIGMYGEGLKPLINGCGEVQSTVLIMDSSNVTVRNLEITNYRSEVTDYRTCINVLSRKKKIENIKIQNNYVHSGSNLYKMPKAYMAGFHAFAGIAVYAEQGKQWDNETFNFENIYIENNRVERVNGTGIATYHGLKNVQIRNNIINNVTGDGIILGHCADSVAEYNIVYTSGFGGIGNPHVNIWTYVATNTVLQYNESYDCQSSVQDGQGFDVDDACVNCTVQYNYSHDNVGGFFLGCAYYNQYYGNVVRYNISQNDKKRSFFMTCPSSKTLKYDPDKPLYEVYNNTVYTNQPMSDVIYNDLFNIKYQKYGSFKNNIFYVVGSPNAGWGESDIAFEFSNNCYYGIDSDVISDSSKITENPMLLAAGTGKVGLSTCGGYQLTKKSPCLNSGALIKNNGGADYFGNKVSGTSAPNIGAYSGGGAERSSDMNLTAGVIPSTSFGSMSHTATLAKLTDEKVTTAVSSKQRKSNGKEWVEFEFQETVPLKCVWLTAAPDPANFPISYKIQVDKNGKWVTVADSKGVKRPSGSETLVFNFGEVKTGKMRIIADELARKDGKYFMELAEIAAFSVPMKID